MILIKTNNFGIFSISNLQTICFGGLCSISCHCLHNILPHNLNNELESYTVKMGVVIVKLLC